MSKQPEALQIADGIEQSTTCIWHPAAAAQIRRLHAANVELLESLTRIFSTVPALDGHGGFCVDHHSPDGVYIGTENIDPAWVIQEMASVAIAAIAKHGSTT